MEHTAVMTMLYATIPRDPIIVRVKMDLLKMAKIALVTKKNGKYSFYYLFQLR